MSATAETIHVLHVDDDPDFAEVAATFLEREDDRIAVRTATDADDGLAMLADREIDCIVSDYDMPGRNGIEFLESVREEHPELPFILYTGKGSEEVASDAISAGVTDYLQKEGGTDQYALLANRIRNAVSARQSAAEVERRRHRLEQILKTIPSCVVQLDYEGRFVFANDRAVEVLGLETSELTDRAYNDPEWNIRDPEGNPIPDEELPFRQVRDSGEPLYGFRHTIEWPDGTRKLLSVNGAPLFDDEGEVESVVFSLTDITGREEREADLRRSSARLAALFENSPDMINVHDAAGNIIDPNPRLREETGYDEETLTDMKVWELDRSIDPDDARALWSDMEVGDREKLEGSYRRRDGSTFPVEVHIRRLDFGGEDQFMAISRNISERKDRERKVDELQRRTESLIRAETRGEIADIAVAIAHDVLDLRLSGVHLVDEDREALEPIAVTDEVRDRLEEAPTYRRSDPSDPAARFNWEVFESGETAVIEDAREHDVIEASETPARSGIVQPLGEHGVFVTTSPDPHAFDDTDIALTELLAMVVTAALDRAERETALRDQKRRLEAETERLEEFAGIVSHDLRNPLNVAQGRVELAREEFDSEHLDAVARAHGRMAELIDDLLGLARDDDPSAVAPVALADLADRCWENVDTGDATIVLDTDRTVRADESRLRQAFENLIRNSVEHGGPGVTVTVGELEDGFYVEDDGAGIPEEERGAVFEAGYSTSESGTGFGLSIVADVADAHGWEVRVTEGSAGGARFEITGVEFADGAM